MRITRPRLDYISIAIISIGILSSCMCIPYYPIGQVDEIEYVDPPICGKNSPKITFIYLKIKSYKQQPECSYFMGLPAIYVRNANNHFLKLRNGQFTKFCLPSGDNVIGLSWYNVEYYKDVVGAYFRFENLTLDGMEESLELKNDQHYYVMVNYHDSYTTIFHGTTIFYHRFKMVIEDKWPDKADIQELRFVRP